MTVGSLFCRNVIPNPDDQGLNATCILDSGSGTNLTLTVRAGTFSSNPLVRSHIFRLFLIFLRFFIFFVLFLFSLCLLLLFVALCRREQ